MTSKLNKLEEEFAYKTYGATFLVGVAYGGALAICGLILLGPVKLLSYVIIVGATFVFIRFYLKRLITRKYNELKNAIIAEARGDNNNN